LGIECGSGGRLEELRAVGEKMRQTSARRLSCPNKSATGNHLGPNDPRHLAVGNGNHRREIRQFAKAFSQMDDGKQKLLLSLAQQMARRHSKV
jgi:hypothetical protein